MNLITRFIYRLLGLPDKPFGYAVRHAPKSERCKWCGRLPEVWETGFTYHAGGDSPMCNICGEDSFYWGEEGYVAWYKDRPNE